MFTIRRVLAVDFEKHKDDFIALARELTDKPIDLKWISAALLRSDTVVLGAFNDDGGLIGMTIGTSKPHLTGHEFYVDDVVTLKSWRRQGVRKQLRDKIREYGRKVDAARVELTTSRNGPLIIYLKEDEMRVRHTTVLVGNL